MKIKGSALLARKQIVAQQFGAGAWAQLVRDVAEQRPFFHAPIVASTLIPVEDFLAFHDELVRRFFDDDQRVYYRLGEESARWALTKGPYKRFLARKDLESMVETLPNLSAAYWDSEETTYAARIHGDVVEFAVTGLPTWHPYFEFLVVGYVKGALELVCGAPVQMERLKGGSGTEYRYAFKLPEGSRS